AAGKKRFEDPNPDVKMERGLIHEERGLNHLATLLSMGPTIFDRYESVQIVAVATGAFVKNSLAISIFSSHNTSPNVSLSNSSSGVAASEGTLGAPTTSTASLDVATAKASSPASSPEERTIASDSRQPEYHTVSVVLTRNSSNSTEGKRIAFHIPAVTPDKDKEFCRDLLQASEESIKGLSFNDFNDFAEKAMRLLKAAAAPLASVKSCSLDRIFLALFHVFHSCLSGQIDQRVEELRRYYCLDDILDNWTPLETDVAEAPVAIKHMHISKHLVGVGLKPVDDGANPLVFIFSAATAPLWWRAICPFLRALLGTISPDNGVIVLGRVFAASTMLHRLLQLVPTLWRLQSLDEHLKTCRTDRFTEDKEHVMEDALPTNNSISDSEVSELERFHRVSDSICVWTTAVRYLLASRLVDEPVAIHMSIVDLPRTPMSTIGPDALIQRWINKGYWASTIAPQIRPLLGKRDPVKNHRSGACHCEAGLMVSLLYTGLNLKDAEATIKEPNSISGAFEVEVIISVNWPPNVFDNWRCQKVLPLCSMLGDTIQSSFKFPVNLPGKHSRFFPWVPLEWLPVNVLLDMETRLLAVVREMVGGDHLTPRALSPYSDRTSEPSSGEEAYDDLLDNMAGVSRSVIKIEHDRRLKEHARRQST
ncbi:hypothetical protein DFH07DRAFT_818351, partial [Mycena maculata]